MSPNTLPPLQPDDVDTYAVGRGRDILVVDDSEANLLAIDAALIPLGRSLVFARSGIEALARLLDQDFGLILLDVAMPGMDGFETARMIRTRRRNRSTPIIFITGLPYEADVVLHGYELGAFDVLIKPVSPEVLRAKAKVYLELQARTFELRESADQLRAAQTHEDERELLRTRAEASEQELRTLVDMLPVLAWTARADGWIEFYNRRWYDYTGTTPAQMEGWGWQTVHDPRTLPQVNANWARSIATGEPFEMKFPLRRADGEFRCHLTRVQPQITASGEVLRWFGTNIDIEEQVQLEASVRVLLESERAARQDAETARQRMALLDSITKDLVGDLHGMSPTIDRVADLVVPALADWCAIYVQREDRSIHAVAVAHDDPAKVATARELLDLFPIDPELPWGVPEILRTGRSELIPTITDEMLGQVATSPDHMRLLRAAGMTSHLAVALKTGGKIVGCMGLTMTESGRRFTPDDLVLAEEIGNRAAMTLEQERLNRATHAARAEAESASRAKDDFLAMLGHELRNPLAPILTALQLMQLRGEGGDRERNVIERQVTHLVRLVDDLLDISRITSGKIELHKERLEIAVIIDKAIEMAGPLLEKRSHDLTISVPRTGLLVEGDAVRLAQVVSNLLTNAAKYSDHASRIAISAHRGDSAIEIRVRDEGTGIAEEMLPRVFELFTQERQSLARSQGGLGLGLAIVRNLVSLHGGTVTATSAGRGRGSEFTVRLPEAPVRPVAEPRDPDEITQVIPSPHRHRVLVVDDNRDAADMLAESLTAMGHVTQVAHDGPTALTIAREFIPDVALLDIGLPVMDGYELAQLLRDEARLDGVRLVALTGYGQEQDRIRSRAAGFDAHMVKPVPVDDIEQLVRKLVAGDDAS